MDRVDYVKEFKKDNSIGEFYECPISTDHKEKRSTKPRKGLMTEDKGNGLQ